MRDTPAAAATHAARLAVCQTCRYRVASRCKLMTMPPSVVARNEHAVCPISRWPGDPPRVSVERQQPLPCIHRGERVRMAACKPCDGGQVGVYACVLHGECILTQRRNVNVRACSRCPDRMELPPVRQRSVGLLVPANNAWTGPARAPLFAAMLESAGYNATIMPSNGRELQDVGRYDLLVNHAMTMPPKAIRELAIQHGNTTFVNVNHSALAHLEFAGDNYTARHIESLRLARDLPNCWYASQEPSAASISEAAGIERCVWWPTPCHPIEPRTYRRPGDPAVVAIAGRQDPIKNNLAQLLACAILNRTRKIRVIMCMDHRQNMDRFAAALGLEHQWRGRLPHGQWLRLLQAEPDCVLCCSLAESFGYVAAEAMQTGVPVVASDAIRFARPDLVARANYPEDIARRLQTALDRHEDEARAAAAIGREVAGRQNQQYLERLKQFLPEAQ